MSIDTIGKTCIYKNKTTCITDNKPIELFTNTKTANDAEDDDFVDLSIVDSKKDISIDRPNNNNDKLPKVILDQSFHSIIINDGYVAPKQDTTSPSLSTIKQTSQRSTNAATHIVQNPVQRPVTTNLAIAKETITYNFASKLPPARLENVYSIKRVVFGDTHGNFQKLVDNFIMAGVLTIAASDYNVIINHPKLLQQYIDNGKLQTHCVLIHIVLLGDIFADRNDDNMAKLLLLSYLSKQRVKLSIMFSNHDLIFYKILFGHIDYSQLPSQYQSCFKYDVLPEEQQAAQTMFMGLICEHYVLCRLQDNIFYSHAPVSITLFNEIIDLVLAANHNEYHYMSLIDRVKYRQTKGLNSCILELNIAFINMITYKVNMLPALNKNITPTKDNYKTILGHLMYRFVNMRYQETHGNFMSGAVMQDGVVINTHVNGHDDPDDKKTKFIEQSTQLTANISLNNLCGKVVTHSQNDVMEHTLVMRSNDDKQQLYNNIFKQLEDVDKKYKDTHNY